MLAERGLGAVPDRGLARERHGVARHLSIDEDERARDGELEDAAEPFESHPAWWIVTRDADALDDHRGGIDTASRESTHPSEHARP